MTNYSQRIQDQIPFNEDEYTSLNVPDMPLTYVPIKGYPYDKRDDKIVYTEKILTDPNLKGVFQKPRLTPEYVDLYEKRLKEQVDLDYERYVFSTLDPTNPYSLKLLDDQYPEFIGKREKSIDDYCEFLKRLTEIALRGEQTREDRELMYAIKSGKIKLPPGIMNDIFNIKSTAELDGKGDEYKRGLFNPKRLNFLTGRNLDGDRMKSSKMPFPFKVGIDGNISFEDIGTKDLGTRNNSENFFNSIIF